MIGVIHIKNMCSMDRGIATKDNLDLIRENEYPYTVITRRQSEKDYKNEFAAIKHFMESVQNTLPEGWESVDKENTVYITKISYYRQIL